MLGRDEVVLETRLLALGGVEDLLERVRYTRLHVARAGCSRPAGDLLLRLGTKSLPVGEELLIEQREQQVLRIDLRVPTPARVLLSASNRFLSLDRQPIEIHGSITPVNRSFHFRHGDCPP